MAGRVRERSPGVFELVVYVGVDRRTGREIRRSRTHHGTRKTAERALAHFVAELDQAGTPTTRGTFGAFLDDWLAAVEPGLSPTTVVGYRSIVESVLKPELGRIRLDRLSAKDLDQFYARVRPGRKAATVRRYHAVAHRALAYAVRWGLIPTNPADVSEPPKELRHEIDPPAVADAERVWLALTARDPDVGTLTRVAAELGCRRGEACALRWSDVAFADGVVTIRRAAIDVGTETTVKTPKSGKVRHLSVDDALLELLRAHRVRMAERAKLAGVKLHRAAYVFSRSGDCSEPYPPRLVSQAWQREARRQGLDARLHDLRHLNATLLLSAGVPINTVQQRLGHAQASTTVNIYGASLDADERAAAAKVARALARPGFVR